MKKLSFLLLFTVFQVNHAMNLGAPSPEKLLASLTLDQKIAQLFMLAVVPDEDVNIEFMRRSPYKMNREHVQKMIEQHGVGGIIFMGSGTPQLVKTAIEHFQHASPVPLLVAIDAEWGLSMRLEGTLQFPRALTLGALAPQHDYLIGKLGEAIGISCKKLGIGMNLAPVVDVNNNPDNPIIGTRSFGEDPELVARKAGEFARGLARAGVLACAKHFPGHGDTTTDSHVDLPIIPHNREHLGAIELRPFQELIAQKIPAIMTGHLHVPILSDEPATLSKRIITDLLQHDLGFEGLVITDGLGMCALTNYYPEDQIDVQALLAGNDMLLGVRNVAHTMDQIKRAIEMGKISQEELDRRVLKVLRAKELHPSLVQFNQEDDDSNFNLKKKLYSSALTLLKNNKGILPIKPKSPVALEIVSTEQQQTQFATTMEKYACRDYTASIIVLAIFQASRSAMIEEWSYSDGLENMPLSQHIRDLQALGHSVVTVLFGSPYIAAQVSDSDALLCAYEDDDDAQYGAALALLGIHNPTGKLPVRASAEFPAGLGLEY